ncbi:hypothetical protein ACOME3_000109 [Neoechinorhynchus agilis]
MSLALDSTPLCVYESKKRSAEQMSVNDIPIVPVNVILRIRPLIDREIKSGSKIALEETLNKCQVQLKHHFFTFDNVFNLQSSHEEVYEESVSGLLNRFFNGCNVTILAYGQTGSGKTYTLGLTNLGSDSIPDGVVLRTLNRLFSRVDREKDSAEYQMSVSALEIYQEKLRDLLHSDSRKTLAIREEGGKIRVNGLSEHSVVSFNDCVRLFAKAGKRRTVGETVLNSESSRSHAVYTLSMKRWTTSSDSISALQINTTADNDEPKRLRYDASSTPYTMIDTITCKLQFVDLAGSERCSRTGIQSDRFKEGIKINMGLLALGNVISLLGNEETCHRHIPYSRLGALLIIVRAC